MRDDVFLIIPAYNESRHIGGVVKRSKKFCSNIIVVDDGSDDRTYDIARTEGIIALRHVVNLGKGSALKTGCEYAFNHGAKMMVVMDADGQHDPNLIPQFVKGLADHDLVYGYRKFDRSMPLVLGMGNRFINGCMRIIHHVDVKDILCGFRSWKRSAYEKIRWESMDYEVETEIIARAARHHLRFTQVAVPTVYLDDYKGTTPLDGVKIVAKMIGLRLAK